MTQDSINLVSNCMPRTEKSLFPYMYMLCMYISLYLFLSFLSEIKADKLANDSHIQIDASTEGLVGCM